LLPTPNCTLHRVESCNRETSTIPIQVAHKTTQTEREISGESRGESSAKARRLVSKCERSTSTSPPCSPGPGNKRPPNRRLEELEKITGYIIIQRFITRTDEEFQNLVKIRFPPDQEQPTTETTAMTPQHVGDGYNHQSTRLSPTPPPSTFGRSTNIR